MATSTNVPRSRRRVNDLIERVTDLESIYEGTTYIRNPNIESPTYGASISGSSVTMVTSAFNAKYRGSVDTHASTSWWISTDANGQTIVEESRNNTSDLLSHTFSKTLTSGATYFLWVQYHGTNTGDSGSVCVVVYIK